MSHESATLQHVRHHADLYMHRKQSRSLHALLQGLRTYVAVNEHAEVQQNPDETWGQYPDDKIDYSRPEGHPYRGVNPEDSRVAVTPMLAHQVLSHLSLTRFHLVGCAYMLHMAAACALACSVADCG